jgi:hypothetical protein
MNYFDRLKKGKFLNLFIFDAIMFKLLLKHFLNCFNFEDINFVHHIFIRLFSVSFLSNFVRQIVDTIRTTLSHIKNAKNLSQK